MKTNAPDNTACSCWVKKSALDFNVFSNLLSVVDCENIPHNSENSLQHDTIKQLVADTQ